MLLRHWDYTTHSYKPFNSPARVLTLYSDDMLAEVDCASCGTRMTYGDGYTSREIHNHAGLGYPVCEVCHEAEEGRYNDSREA